MEKPCPNINGCRLVKTDAVVPNPDQKAAYISAYCHREETWRKCKRYQTKRSLWICPDFVLPDSQITEEEVIDLYEKLEKKDQH
jgi:hypothetical protein